MEREFKGVFINRKLDGENDMKKKILIIIAIMAVLISSIAYGTQISKKINSVINSKNTKVTTQNVQIQKNKAIATIEMSTGEKINIE